MGQAYDAEFGAGDTLLAKERESAGAERLRLYDARSGAARAEVAVGADPLWVIDVTNL